MNEPIVVAVLPHVGFRWRVEDEHNHQVIGIERTKPEAMRLAKDVIKRSEGPGILKVYGIHGQMQSQHSYGIPSARRHPRGDQVQRAS